MSQMTFYTHPQSRSRVVDIMLAELGIDCKRVQLEYGTSMKAPEYLAINPFGKVPALVDGEVVIYELAAICAYLADKYADKGLAPALNDPKRGLYYRWLFMVAGPWSMATTDQVLGATPSKEQEGFVGYGNYETALNALISGLSEANPYLCGEQFTAADVFVGSHLMYMLSFQRLEPHPVILRYTDSLKQRPSFQAAFAPTP